MRKRAVCISSMILLTFAPLFAAPAVIKSTTLTLRGEPKYQSGFTRFAYTSPDAKKGGTLVLNAIGTFDNFHRYALRGSAAAGATTFYDTLMGQNSDEVDVYYPLIAESVEYPPDFRWIVFHINPKARAQNGTPLTAEDVAFSFTTFYTKGVPQFRQYYKDVKVEALDRSRVRFTLPKGDRELMVSLAGLTILPKCYWKDRDFGEPLMTVPVGSGAYTVRDFKMGQYVVYERLKDYWAMDLPVNRGQLNFDRIRYDYYRDSTVALEAFKAGEYDYRQESDALNWVTMYKGPAFDAKQILKAEVPNDIPQAMRALVFNIQRPLFQDRRVRMAVNLAMDFEWTNKNLFYGLFTRTRSFFQNTAYEAKELPSAEELRILEPIRSKIPPEVFTAVYEPPKTDGSGFIRDNLRKAFALLKEAGWELRDRKLVNVKTGKPMAFELLIYSPTTERFAIPLRKNLERLGIEMKIRTVDTSQFVNRLRSRDFDMIANGYSANYYPGSDLKIVWRSDYMDYTYNTAGVQDPAVDYLVDGIAAHQDDPAALLAWGRALDRVLTWNCYLVPQWHQNVFWISWANKFSMPEVRPRYDVGIDSWWVDAQKEAALGKMAKKGAR